MPSDAEVQQQINALLEPDPGHEPSDSVAAGLRAPIPAWAGLAMATVAAIVGLVIGAVMAGDTTTVVFPSDLTVSLDGGLQVEDITTSTSTTSTPEPPPETTTTAAPTTTKPPATTAPEGEGGGGG